MYTALIAQASDSATQNANAFWDTSFGQTIKVLLASAAILLILVAIFKSSKHFMSGKIGEGVKVIGGAVVMAVFLFRPETLTDLVNLVGSLFDSLFSSGTELVNDTNVE